MATDKWPYKEGKRIATIRHADGRVSYVNDACIERDITKLNQMMRRWEHCVESIYANQGMSVKATITPPWER